MCTIDSVEALDTVVRSAVAAAGATLIDLALRAFPGDGGITGYALLAESHLGIHTWPERDYVAIDVFMCGDAHAEAALEVLRRAFVAVSDNGAIEQAGFSGTSLLAGFLLVSLLSRQRVAGGGHAGAGEQAADHLAAGTTGAAGIADGTLSGGLRQLRTGQVGGRLPAAHPVAIVTTRRIPS